MQWLIYLGYVFLKVFVVFCCSAGWLLQVQSTCMLAGWLLAACLRLFFKTRKLLLITLFNGDWQLATVAGDGVGEFERVEGAGFNPIF